MTRYGLRDEQWERIKDLLQGKPGDPVIRLVVRGTVGRAGEVEGEH